MTKLKWGESGFGINVIATGETDHEFEPDINITKRLIQNMMENSHHFLLINEIIHYWYYAFVKDIPISPVCFLVICP